MSNKTVLDNLAALEHNQWAHWTAYMLDHLTDANIERWKRQLATPYADLSEKEKESDREWARKALSVIRTWARPRSRAALLAEVEELRTRLTLTPEKVRSLAAALAEALDTGGWMLVEDITGDQYYRIAEHALKPALLAAGMREQEPAEDTNRKEPPMPNACTE